MNRFGAPVGGRRLMAAADARGRRPCTCRSAPATSARSAASSRPCRGVRPLASSRTCRRTELADAAPHGFPEHGASRPRRHRPVVRRPAPPTRCARTCSTCGHVAKGDRVGYRQRPQPGRPPRRRQRRHVARGRHGAPASAATAREPGDRRRRGACSRPPTGSARPSRSRGRCRASPSRRTCSAACSCCPRGSRPRASATRCRCGCG